MKRIVKKKKLDEFIIELQKEATKVDPSCQHYGKCGGCSMQNVSYDDQTRIKFESFKKLIEQEGLEEEFEDANFHLVQSPEQDHYRQRVDLVFDSRAAGFRRKNSKEVIELEDCELMRPGAFDVFAKVRSYVREKEFTPYNVLNATGFLRYFILRQTRDGQRMLILLTAAHDHAEDIEALATELIASGELDSFHWLVNSGRSDVSFGSSYKFWGKEYIYETFLDNDFLLGPNTFFQSNAYVAEKAYSLIKEDVAKYKPKHLLDLYSGTCTIGIILSKEAESITAVENIPANRDLAVENFKNNDVSNIDYINDDCELFMKTYEGDPDYVVCNPPRTGVDEKTVRKLNEIRPNQMAYLACNPKTLLEDLGILTIRYEITDVYVLDMFPQTHHFETLVFLKKI